MKLHNAFEVAFMHVLIYAFFFGPLLLSVSEHERDSVSVAESWS